MGARAVPASLSAGAILSATLAIVSAQGQPTQKPPVFRATTNIIQTDVAVLDRDGRPVRGLTIDDFELYEDGERVELLGFAEVNIPDAVDAPSWMRDSSPDVRTALNGRVMVFLLDDGQEPYLMRQGRGYVHPDERLAAVKRIVEQFLNRMGPEDMAAVICTYDKRCDQDFTSDRERIRAAVAKFQPKSPPPGYGASPYKVSANMAESIAKMLQGQASRRRSIVYVSRRLPLRPAVWPPPSDGAGNPNMSMDDIQALVTFEAAMRSGITVYGVNPSSMLSLKDALPDDPDAPESNRVVPFTAPPRSLSAETGGFNINRPADFAEGVVQFFRETGSYYLLGYEPPERKVAWNMVKGLREIEVRVKREGLTVKSRRGYIETPPEKTPKNPPAESTSALAGVLPKTDLPLRVSAAPFAIPGKADVLVAVTLGITQPSSASQGRDYIDVQVRAFTTGGKERAAVRHRVDARLAPSKTGSSTTEVVSELLLKPGTYSVRASAFSERMGESGSVYADVVVPDFAKEPLALSGLLVMASPAPESATPVPLSLKLPVEPTTERNFTGTSLVRALVRVYQGGQQPVTAVTVKTTIVGEKGNVVSDQSQTLPAERFSESRSTDARLVVPVSTLDPGIYRLRVEAFAGSRIVFRDAHIRVR